MVIFFQNGQILWSIYERHTIMVLQLPHCCTETTQEWPWNYRPTNCCWGELYLQFKALESLDPGSSIGAPTFSQTIPNSQVDHEKNLSQGKELVIWGGLGFQMFFHHLAESTWDWFLNGDWDRYDMMIWWNPRCIFLSHFLFYPTIQL